MNQDRHIGTPNSFTDTDMQPERPGGQSDARQQQEGDSRGAGGHWNNMSSPQERHPSSRQFASRRSSSPLAETWPARSEQDGRRSPPARSRASWSRSRSRSVSPRRGRSSSRSKDSRSPGSSPGSDGRGGYKGAQFREPPSRRPAVDRNSDLCTIYVGGLPYDTTQQDVHDHFSRYGEVTKVRLIKDHETQEFRGFGFVTFRSTFAAEDAAEDADGKEVLGARVKVNIAKYKGVPRPAHRDERMHAYDATGAPSHAHTSSYRSQPSGPAREISQDYGSPRSPRGSPSWQRSHRPSSPKRRRRSSDYEGRHSADGAELEQELRRTKEELKAVQRGREQAQREFKDVKQQLDELTAQANAKLSDQRSKMKVSKRRSMLRGKQLMGLVEAARHVKSCQEAVEQAEKALSEAKANLVVVLGQAQDYITTEQAEDEASDRERAVENEARQRSAAPAGGTAATTSATQPVSTHSTPVGSMRGTGLALKPFKISLDPA